MASILPLAGNLNTRLAAHLLRRCTYLPTKANIDSFASKTVDQAVEDLFQSNPLTISEPIDFETGQTWINSGIDPISNQDRCSEFITGWWVNQGLMDLSIRPKLTFWLHTTFTASKGVGSSRHFYDHVTLLRYFAYNNLKELAKQMTFDNTMLLYLNGGQNTENDPNENYAREFLELFTIGKGPQIGPGNYTFYTEDDVITAAKLLTGFRITWDRPIGGDPAFWNATIGIQTGRAAYWAHDKTDKTFSAAFDNQTILGATDEADMYRELGDFVEMIFQKSETAKNYCRKLYRYFVNKKISVEVENDIIAPMAQTMINSNYDLIPSLKQLLKSQHFFDKDDNLSGDEHFGNLLKSPMESALQSISFFNISLPNAITDPENHYHRWYFLTLNNTIGDLAGMNIFRPASVAGYPAYFQAPLFTENWFSGSTLIPRYKVSEILLTGQRVLNGGNNGGVQLDIVNFVANGGVISNPSNANTLVTEFTTYLFPEIPTAKRFDYFLNDVFLDNLSPINWQFEWQNYINTGNDAAVRIPLEKLFTALLSSQEYVLM